MTKTDEPRPAEMFGDVQRDGRKHEGDIFPLTIDFSNSSPHSMCSQEVYA